MSSDSWAFLQRFCLFINFWGKKCAAAVSFLFLFKSSIVWQRDCQLLYYQPNCFKKKKKKRNYKKNFFKGTLLKAGRAKIRLASCVLVCGHVLAHDRNMEISRFTLAVWCSCKQRGLLWIPTTAPWPVQKGSVGSHTHAQNTAYTLCFHCQAFIIIGN